LYFIIKKQIKNTKAEPQHFMSYPIKSDMRI
jgi:hypothetical protein